REALEASLRLTDEERGRMHERARAHVLESFTTEAQAPEYLAVLEAADLHRALASRTSAQGRAAIAFFFPAGDLNGPAGEQVRLALLAGRYRFRILLCFPGQGPIDPELVELAGGAGAEVHRFEPGETAGAWLERHDVR